MAKTIVVREGGGSLSLNFFKYRPAKDRLQVVEDISVSSTEFPSVLRIHHSTLNKGKLKDLQHLTGKVFYQERVHLCPCRGNITAENGHTD